MSTIIAQTLSNGTVSTSTANCIQGSAKAWVNFNGTGTVAIRASYNVSSITDNGTGDYTVNFTNAMPDGNYSFVAFAKTSTSGVNRTAFANGDNGNTTQSASSYRFYTTNLGGTPTDTDFINAVIFR